MKNYENLAKFRYFVENLTKYVIIRVIVQYGRKQHGSGQK